MATKKQSATNAAGKAGSPKNTSIRIRSAKARNAPPHWESDDGIQEREPEIQKKINEIKAAHPERYGKKKK